MNDASFAISPLRFEGYGLQVTDADREHWYEQRARQAQAAFDQGHICIGRGLSCSGLFWFGRAERLAGDNAHVTFSYAMTAFELEQWTLALPRLQQLQKRFDLREAAFSVVSCLYHMGRIDEAATALGTALSRYHATEELYTLASELARLNGAPGWATLSNKGLLRVRTAEPFRLGLDRQRLGEFPAGQHVLSDGAQGGLAPEWFKGNRLSVRVNGQHVLGSPFDITALTWCDSLLRPVEGGVSGWLWYPAEPHFEPRVYLEDIGQIPTEEDVTLSATERPLWRPRSFFIPLEQLPGQGRLPVMMREVHGRALSGAPLDPRLGRLLAGKKPFPAHLRPVPVKVRPSRSSALRTIEEPGCVVIIPVYRDYRTTMTCLKSVLETVGEEVEVFVVDDATPEPSLAQALDCLAQQRKITLLRHRQNQGFPVSVNHALRYAGQRDVILLNSDTVVFPGWVKRLRRWLQFQNVGTVTPLSNEGGLLSYPSSDKDNPFPTLSQARKLDALCQEFADTKPVEMPTGNGFCMAISAGCLAETGLLREDIFAQGYGEENDFCLRATNRGFCHVAATDVYVRHVGGASFQAGRRELVARNLEILNALHPGYNQIVHFFQKSDPLKLIRRRLDQAELEGWRINQKRPRGVVVMIQHNAGGGVARVVRERAARFAHQGILALSLKPAVDGCILELCDVPEALPNMHFSLSSEGAFLVAFLKRLRVMVVEWHHLVGHASWIRRLHRLLDVPYDVFIHDHVWFCPRIALLDLKGRYCGEPDIRGCEVCIAGGGSIEENLPVPEMLRRSSRELTEARRVVAPSEDAARRLKRHIQSCGSLHIEPWEDDKALLGGDLMPMRRSYPRRIGVVGGISVWKGYNIIKELGEYIQDNNFPIEIIVIGGTENDDDLIASGVKVTGEYQEKDALYLIGEQRIDLGFIPSIAPETWCYALGWLWKAGLEVVCFDIGAVSERVKQSHRGVSLPLGMPVARLAEFLLHYHH